MLWPGLADQHSLLVSLTLSSGFTWGCNDICSTSAPPKQCHFGRPWKEYFFLAFPENQNICPTYTLQGYVERTHKVMGSDSTGEAEVFLSLTKPHRCASRWIKTILSNAGIDTSIFRALSIRRTSTSASSKSRFFLPEIFEVADFSNQSTFDRFCFRPQIMSNFGTSVLRSTSNLQSWYMKTEHSEMEIIIG